MKSRKWLDIEEALGVIWDFRERKGADVPKLRVTLTNDVSESVFQDLIDHNLIRVTGDAIELTPEGEDIGRDIKRRHRLAERLLADVIEVKSDDLGKSAWEFEHIISSDVADSICTLLGHPTVCPHGAPIPAGPCCKKAQESLESIVAPLSRLDVGDEGIVAYIMTTLHPHLHKLLALGIVPGSKIRLQQKSPSCVIALNEARIALDNDAAGQIYLRRG